MSGCSLSNSSPKRQQLTLKGLCSSTERLHRSLHNRSKGESSWFGFFFLFISLNFILTHLGWRWIHLAKVLLLVKVCTAANSLS